MKRTLLTLSLLGLLAANNGLAADAPEYWKWAPTPPMGWNSYDVYGDSVSEAETLANADYMRDHLMSHGWKYVVIDFRWYDPLPPNTDGDINKLRTGEYLAADQYGRLIPAGDRFPSSVNGVGFKALADKIHAMGLKFGLHMMRGIPRESVIGKTPIADSTFTAADAGNVNDKCGWCPDMYGVQDNAAGQAWYDSEYKLFASWGLDFVKVDDLSVPYHKAEIEMIRKAIDKSGRAIVFSTSPGATDPKMADHISVNANMWRVSGDFWDRWRSLDKQFDLLSHWIGVGGPGHFPDADMIPFGHLGIRSWIAGKERQSRFTPDEEKMLMTLWPLSASPLMLGWNLPDTDAATLALITNDEVLAIDQDPNGVAATRAVAQGGLEVWVRTLSDNSKAIGLFNRTKDAASVNLKWSDTGLMGKQTLRDVWAQKDLGTFADQYSATVPSHGAVLIRTRPAN
jgi:alpha-galactosidase